MTQNECNTTDNKRPQRLPSSLCWGTMQAPNGLDLRCVIVLFLCMGEFLAWIDWLRLRLWLRLA
jgi:hypothetical protein